MDKAKQIVEYFESNLTEDELVKIHNEYCDRTHNDDDRIYYMWEVEDLFAGMSVGEIIENARNLKSDDVYMCCTIWGWQSFTYYCDSDVACEDDIADYCVRNEYDFGNLDIWEILEQEEENEQ